MPRQLTALGVGGLIRVHHRLLFPTRRRYSLNPNLRGVTPAASDGRHITAFSLTIVRGVKKRAPSKRARPGSRMEERSAIRSGLIRFLMETLGQSRQLPETPIPLRSEKRAALRAWLGRGPQLFRHCHDGGTNQWLNRTQSHTPLANTWSATARSN